VVAVVVPDDVVVAVPAAEEKPNAANAACALGSADEAEIEKLAALGVLIVTAPPSMLEGVVVPVIESIAESKLPTVPDVVLMTKGLPDVLVGSDDEKLMVVPLTLMVSPLAKLAESESVPGAPDSAVAAVIGAGGVCWLVATAPVAELEGSKKSFPAATAEAATSVVFASVLIDVFKAEFRLAAVAAGVAPIVKLPDGGGFWLDAVN
jgi:hypothetical protein